ncbi:MAG: transporter, partial [Rikenellaceae bacterium]|nr:transporter [Rikenellaceae bacterium]
FGILLLDKQIALNELMAEELQRNYKQVDASVNGGVANRADLDAVKVEQLNTQQNTSTMRSSREAYAAMLAVLTGLAEEDMKLVEPVDPQVGSGPLNRPELWLMDAQQDNLNAQIRSLNSRNRPTLGAFAQGGYGQPGLNMLKTGFEPYYIVGVRLSWNFGTLYTKRNDRRVIENNIRSVDAQRETFVFNNRMQTIGERRRVDNIRQIMQQDEQIVLLRENIHRAAEAKMAAGTMSGTELMREVTAENLARQTMLLHQVQLLQAIYELKTTQNN